MKALRNSLLFVVAFLIVYVLVVAKDLLIPLVLAFFFWYLINNLRMFFAKLRFGAWRLPRGVPFALALLTIALAAGLLAKLISDNVSQVAAAAPVYQGNLERLVTKTFAFLEIEEPPEEVGQLFQDVKLSGLISNAASALTNLLGNAGLVVIYLVFLFFEEKFFEQKMKALFPNPERRREIDRILSRIGADTRAYISLKTLVSIMTAVFSYVVMRIVGLDYAEFWSILIFVFNFIPNLGSLIATLLPSLLALVQFDHLRPFFVVAGGVTAIQLFVANVIEPRIMAGSLNMSPLVIILSLVLWGTLWGVPGMFLCVPLMAILMIVFSHFPQTRPLAILMSEDGQVTE